MQRVLHIQQQGLGSELCKEQSVKVTARLQGMCLLEGAGGIDQFHIKKEK